MSIVPGRQEQYALAIESNDYENQRMDQFYQEILHDLHTMHNNKK